MAEKGVVVSSQRTGTGVCMCCCSIFERGLHRTALLAQGKGMVVAVFSPLGVLVCVAY
jgi:hypothetical protein